MRAGVADYFSVVALSEVPRRELLDECLDAGAETPSITRLEGSRWRGGRLWSYKPGSTVSGERIRVAWGYGQLAARARR